MLAPAVLEISSRLSIADDEYQSIATPILDQHQRRAAAESADVARCPVCRWPLVARMTCRRPGFVCLCADAPFR
ncbi:MAG: hypothetical protein ACRD36_06010 [Candidatus Acidiferrum sp.]